MKIIHICGKINVQEPNRLLEFFFLLNVSLFYNEKKMDVETIFTQKLLVNFTITKKQKATYWIKHKI